MPHLELRQELLALLTFSRVVWIAILVTLHCNRASLPNCESLLSAHSLRSRVRGLVEHLSRPNRGFNQLCASRKYGDRLKICRGLSQQEVLSKISLAALPSQGLSLYCYCFTTMTNSRRIVQLCLCALRCLGLGRM